MLSALYVYIHCTYGLLIRICGGWPPKVNFCCLLHLKQQFQDASAPSLTPNSIHFPLFCLVRMFLCLVGGEGELGSDMDLGGGDGDGGGIFSTIWDAFSDD